MSADQGLGGSQSSLAASFTKISSTPKYQDKSSLLLIRVQEQCMCVCACVRANASNGECNRDLE